MPHPQVPIINYETSSARARKRRTDSSSDRGRRLAPAGARHFLPSQTSAHDAFLRTDPDPAAARLFGRHAALVSVIIFAAVEVLPGDVGGAHPRPRSRRGGAQDQLRTELGLDRPVVARYLTGPAARSRAISARRCRRASRSPRSSSTTARQHAGARRARDAALHPAVDHPGAGAGPPPNRLPDRVDLDAHDPDPVDARIPAVDAAAVRARRGLPDLPAARARYSGRPMAGHIFYMITLPAVSLAHPAGRLRHAAAAREPDRTLSIPISSAWPSSRACRAGASCCATRLPNALIPWLNATAINFAFMIGGVVVVERVFVFPGFGSLLVDAMQLRDIPLIEASVLIAAFIFIAVNLIADVGALLLNPKLRTGRRERSRPTRPPCWRRLAGRRSASACCCWPSTSLLAVLGPLHRALPAAADDDRPARAGAGLRIRSAPTSSAATSSAARCMAAGS